MGLNSVSIRDNGTGDTLQELREIQSELRTVGTVLGDLDSKQSTNLAEIRTKWTDVTTVETTFRAIETHGLDLEAKLDVYFDQLARVANLLSSARSKVDDLADASADIQYIVTSSYLSRLVADVIGRLELSTVVPGGNFSIQSVESPNLTTQQSLGREPCDIYCADELGVSVGVDLTYLGQSFNIIVYFAIGISVATGAPKAFVAHRAQLRSMYSGDADNLWGLPVEDVETIINDRLLGAVQGSFDLTSVPSIPGGPNVKLLTNTTGPYRTVISGAARVAVNRASFSPIPELPFFVDAFLRIRLTVVYEAIISLVVSATFGFAAPPDGPDVVVQDEAIGWTGGYLRFMFNVTVPAFGVYPVPVFVWFLPGATLKAAVRYWVPGNFRWQWHGIYSGEIFDWQERNTTKDIVFHPDTSFVVASIVGDSLYIALQYK